MSQRGTPSYTVTIHQRELVFSHVLGLVLYIQAVHSQDNPSWTVKDGTDAIAMFHGYAKLYNYENVRDVFNTLPGDPYRDFTHYWNMVHRQCK